MPPITIVFIATGLIVWLNALYFLGVGADQKEGGSNPLVSIGNATLVVGLLNLVQAVYIMWARPLDDASIVLAGLVTFYGLFFVVLGIPSGGFNQAAQNMVLEFGRVHDIPLRVAASGTAVNVVAAAGPFVGGVLVAVWSYPALFGVTVALQLLALVIVIAWTPEPRFADAGAAPRVDRGEAGEG